MKAYALTDVGRVRQMNQDYPVSYTHLEGEGLLARAICHECDHLKGQLYVSLVEGKLEDVMMEEVEE